MAATCVRAKDGTRLVPTTNVKKVRRLLKEGKAEIFSYKPFTVRLLYDIKNPPSTEPLEISVDAGKEHAGLSVKTAKHEYFSEQRDLLPDEKERHDEQRKTRRARRNRKRYRKPWFDNRKKGKGWFAPSVRHAEEAMLWLIGHYASAVPVTDVYIEVGAFDTQALAAIEAGEPLPEGEDYQKGPCYKQDTLREAVFYRDHYTCICCGRSPLKGDKIGLVLHHMGFRYGDHSDRMGNLGCVCTDDHIPVQHQPGGILYEMDPKVKPLDGAAFMNTVRWDLLRKAEALGEIYGFQAHATYGSVTKRERKKRKLAKSHAIDAYCIGRLHPGHRAKTKLYRKVRRNSRRLQKFQDAVYIDIRDGSKKKGSELGCNRINRKYPRDNPQNLRTCHGEKVSKGSTPVRRRRYSIRPGDTVLYNKKKCVTEGPAHYGECISFNTEKEVPLDTLSQPPSKKMAPGWEPCEGKTALYSGGRKPTKKMVLSVNKEKGTATLKWQVTPPVDGVKVLRHCGGWRECPPEGLIIYKPGDLKRKHKRGTKPSVKKKKGGAHSSPSEQ